MRSLLDDEGSVLGHIFYPNYNYSTVEIHIDSDELWCLEVVSKNYPSDEISLLTVLIHEIEHTLGIAHSNYKTLIMFVYYTSDKNKPRTGDIITVQVYTDMKH